MVLHQLAGLEAHRTPACSWPVALELLAAYQAARRTQACSQEGPVGLQEPRQRPEEPQVPQDLACPLLEALEAAEASSRPVPCRHLEARHRQELGWSGWRQEQALALA